MSTTVTTSTRTIPSEAWTSASEQTEKHQPHSHVLATDHTQPPQGLSATATGGFEFPGVPTFDDPYKKRQWQLEHMAGAFRVFARKGFTEGTAGHISVRDPVDHDTFWINPLVQYRVPISP